MTTRWNNEYFARIRLIPAYWLDYSCQLGYTIEQYVNYMKKQKYVRDMERAKEKGQEYFTPDRVIKMLCTQRLATD